MKTTSVEIKNDQKSAGLTDQKCTFFLLLLHSENLHKKYGIMTSESGLTEPPSFFLRHVNVFSSNLKHCHE